MKAGKEGLWPGPEGPCMPTLRRSVLSGLRGEGRLRSTAPQPSVDSRNWASSSTLSPFPRKHLLTTASRGELVALWPVQGLGDKPALMAPPQPAPHWLQAVKLEGRQAGPRALEGP